MKKFLIKYFLPVTLLYLLTSSTLELIYKDGTYNGISNSIYTLEPYYGKTTLKVENGRIVNVRFVIRDSVKHIDFNADYEKYFNGDVDYVMQCRNDWQGAQSYPDSLLKYQDIRKVDAITGATWSYNLFKASVLTALRLQRVNRPAIYDINH